MAVSEQASLEGAATANRQPTRVSSKTRNEERLFFLGLFLFARLIIYRYGFPGASPPFASSVDGLQPPLRTIAAAALVVVWTLILVLPGLWFSEQIDLVPSPLIRKWLSRQQIARREWTRILWMIPAGWGLFVIGAVGGLIPMAFGVPVPKATGKTAVALSILSHASTVGVISITFANAVAEECIFHLFGLAGIAWIISRFWHEPDGAPTAGAMWLAIAIQAPIFSALNLQGRLDGLRLVIDAHTAYGVILGWLYWRYGFEASLIATWSLVASRLGLGALIRMMQSSRPAAAR
ncbi:MAG: type II CAAX prenyl endopeptidase Rce1 family protein [Candidatus Binataceae bacterium]